MYTIVFCIATISVGLQTYLESARLQGRWRAVEGMWLGEKVADIESHELTITATHFRFTQKTGNPNTMTYRLRFGDPRSVDLIRSEGLQKGNLYKCIYKLDKDRLTFFMGAGNRPETLRPADALVFYVYQRIK